MIVLGAEKSPTCQQNASDATSVAPLNTAEVLIASDTATVESVTDAQDPLLEDGMNQVTTMMGNVQEDVSETSFANSSTSDSTRGESATLPAEKQSLLMVDGSSNKESEVCQENEAIEEVEEEAVGNLTENDICGGTTLANLEPNILETEYTEQGDENDELEYDDYEHQSDLEDGGSVEGTMEHLVGRKDIDQFSDYASGSSTPSLGGSTSRAPSTGPSSPSTRPITRSRSRGHFMAALDQDDSHDLELMSRILQQQKQRQRLHLHKEQQSEPGESSSSSSIPSTRQQLPALQPVTEIYTSENALWRRQYFGQARSPIARTPSKKRDARGKLVQRSLSPPRRLFDPLSYDPMANYKLKIPTLPCDTEDDDPYEDELDDEHEKQNEEVGEGERGRGKSQQDLSLSIADGFWTPKKKKRSAVFPVQPGRPFSLPSSSAFDIGRFTQRPLRENKANSVSPQGQKQELRGVEEKEDTDGLVCNTEVDGDLVDETELDGDSALESDYDDHMILSTPTKPKSRSTRNALDDSDDNLDDDDDNFNSGNDNKNVSSLSPNPFLFGNEFETPPRKQDSNSRFDTIQPPPAPKMSWATLPFSMSVHGDHSDRGGNKVVGWRPLQSMMSSHESPSRNRTLKRYPNHHGKL
ncbi:hypothetical protein BGZ94_007205 [Podila epigama]|nr:hypothetical protein BGZ94_007205 [Podila epigama]